MRVAYGDLVGGLSGDMCVAAFLDAGLPLEKLKLGLKKLPGLRYRIEVAKKKVDAIQATRFSVICEKEERERSWKEIRSLVQQSALDHEVKGTALQIFSRLAEAEGKIHALAAQKVHFHEVGATDSIVDIVSTAVAVHQLKIKNFAFSRVPLGRGVAHSRHGPLPLPAPATLELLKGLPVEWIPIEAETVTPTGAAIVSALGSSFGESTSMIVDKIGYGAGEKVFLDRPNLFRLALGEEQGPWKQEQMVILETNIDNMNPEFYDYVLDRLFAAGARDVFLSAIQMKKNRPGTLLSVISTPADKDKLAEIILRETSTIGIRYYPVGRIVLKRGAAKLKTRFGIVKIKIIEQPDGTKQVTPEYDDLKRIASARKVPLKIVYDEVLKRFQKS